MRPGRATNVSVEQSLYYDPNVIEVWETGEGAPAKAFSLDFDPYAPSDVRWTSDEEIAFSIDAGADVTRVAGLGIVRRAPKWVLRATDDVLNSMDRLQTAAHSLLSTYINSAPEYRELYVDSVPLPIELKGQGTYAYGNQQRVEVRSVEWRQDKRDTLIVRAMLEFQNKLGAQVKDLRKFYLRNRGGELSVDWAASEGWNETPLKVVRSSSPRCNAVLRVVAELSTSFPYGTRFRPDTHVSVGLEPPSREPYASMNGFALRESELGKHLQALLTGGGKRQLTVQVKCADFGQHYVDIVRLISEDWLTEGPLEPAPAELAEVESQQEPQIAIEDLQVAFELRGGIGDQLWVPFVKATVRNKSSRPIVDLKLQMQFVDTKEKRFFGDKVTDYVISPRGGTDNLESGMAKVVFLYGNVGYRSDRAFVGAGPPLVADITGS